MFGLKLVFCSCLIALTVAQDYQTEYNGGGSNRQAPLRLNTAQTPEKKEPIAILKQINKHNEDGSYTYGYEGADGSFKIETKLATGEVKGKYGYVDETGEVRIVEYGANKYGFQPSGKGITVAPPTLIDETTNKNGINPDYDDYEQPQAPARRPQPQAPRASRPRPIEEPEYFNYEEPKAAPAPRPKYTQAAIQTGPAPARLHSIPGAAPVDVVYSDRPRPPRPDSQYTQQQNFGGPQQFPNQHVQQQQQQQPQSNFRLSKPQPSFIPAPQPKQVAYTAPRFAPQQQQQQPQPQQYFAPEPQQQYAPQPKQQQQPQQQQYAPQPKQHSQQGRSSSSLLDQLAKDYALPEGGSPSLHDISFGFY